MTHEQQIRARERMRTLRIPERMKDYKVMLAELPGYPQYDVIYDMPKRTIWINTAAEPDANMSWLETEK